MYKNPWIFHCTQKQQQQQQREIYSTRDQTSSPKSEKLKRTSALNKVDKAGTKILRFNTHFPLCDERAWKCYWKWVGFCKALVSYLLMALKISIPTGICMGCFFFRLATSCGVNKRIFLGLAGAADRGRAHLCENLVQPLQGSVQVQLYPAGGASDRLPPAKQSDGGKEERELRLRKKSCLIFFKNSSESRVK